MSVSLQIVREIGASQVPRRICTYVDGIAYQHRTVHEQEAFLKGYRHRPRPDVPGHVGSALIGWVLGVAMTVAVTWRWWAL